MLYTSAEADGFDIATLHGIGLSGLSELAALDGRFAAFEATVFSDSWRGLDRETCDPSRIPEVDAAIASFFRLLSSHFLTKASAKAIEYLLRRFKVHVFNIDSVLACALPYHDSVFFGRVVQVLEIGGASASSGALGPGSASAQIWGFLSSCKATGTPAPRALFTGQCLKDLAVLRFLGDEASEYAKSDGDGEADASAFLTFYSLVLAEISNYRGTLAEPTVALLLQLALRGIKDRSCPAHQTSGQLVASALSQKLPLTRGPFEGVLNSVIRSIRWGAVVGEDDEGEDSGSSVAATSSLASSLACAAALVASQAAHQSISARDVVSGSGAGGTRWLPAFRLSKRSLKAALKPSSRAAFAAALGGLCARFDASALAALLLASLLAQAAESPSESPDALQLARQIVAALPSGAAGALTAPLITSLLAVHPALEAAASSTEGETSGATAGVAAAASLLRYVTQTHPAHADGALQKLVVAANATGAPASATAQLSWVSGVLVGSQHDASAVEVAQPGGATSSVSLSLALSHASGTVRAQSMPALAKLAATLIDVSDDADNEEGGAPASRASTARFLATSLARCVADDSEASVVTSAVGVHAQLLGGGHLLLPGVADGASGVTASSLETLLASLQTALEHWAGAAFARDAPAPSVASAAGVVVAILRFISGPFAAAVAQLPSADGAPLARAVALTLLQRLPIGSESSAAPASEAVSAAVAAKNAIAAAALSGAASLASSQPLFSALPSVSVPICRRPTFIRPRTRALPMRTTFLLAV